tara:strand:- start:5758 stop:6522 length:765 start_codon:yes stop_codon:yes gene_type:complete
MMKKYTFFLILCLSISFSSDAQSLKAFKNKALNLKNNLKKTSESIPTITEDDAAKALKEALNNGINNSVDIVSKTDGYLQNPEIKIPFPQDAKKIEDRLRSLGLNKLVDDAILFINRAAENAATEAKPLIIQAIKNMTIKDAVNIVKGKEDEGTNYLKINTFDSLYEKFLPPIEISLEKVNATKHWSNVVNTYNKIPLIQKVDPDLDDYVTRKALDGLFIMIAKEEKKIREKPLLRVTETLKKVFDLVDDQTNK